MKLLKRILKKESGQVLPMALVLMVLGGLLVVPVLSLMTTNLTANREIVENTLGIYAADAGIMDAFWKVGNGIALFASDNSYDLTEEVNGMTVTVELQNLEVDLYTIRSTARLNGEIKSVIEAQAVAGSDFSWLFEHAITSSGSITTKSSDVIYGGILYQGTYDNNADVRTGEVRQGTVTFPTEAQLSAYYLSNFSDNVCADPANYCPDNPYSSSTYTVSGGTSSNPVIIPWLYCTGDLSINGSGYAQLSGTIYVNGKFNFSDKDVILLLDGQTIYATYYQDPCPTTPNASNSAVYFGPDCELHGPGCVIGVGHVEFQPKLGQGNYLLGADDVDTGTTTDYQDRFLLSKFESKNIDKLSSIQVKCYIADPEAPPAHVKVALYADNNGSPGTLLGSVDCADNITVSSWKPVSVPEIAITKTNYWLAAISDADIISTKTLTSTNKYEVADFTGFTFPNPAGTGFTDQTANQYMLRGFTGGQEFIFLMSVKCTTNLQPSANFYGSIAGSANVNLQPGCTLNLVGVPEEGLDFPGDSGSGGGSGEGGNSPPLLKYNIIK
ncbi:MAG: hypothetical protein FJ023_06555 [Chloroflexi bacterium]|nr:hypothetical protein [Chloroflexota bacterium]